MNVEHKYIDLKDLKVSSEGPGTIEGYRAVFNEIDEGGDIIIPGFFKDAIPEYLEVGFSAHSHDWDFDKSIGFPIEAKEDDYGFFVKSQFFSTPDAQSVRQKAKERMDAGKQVKFSFGYLTTEKDIVDAKDYDEVLVKYIKPDRLQANLAKAKNFPRIRILKKGECFEDSIVTAPMNKLASATAIKSSDPIPEFIKEHGHEAIIQAINSELPEADHYLKGESVADSFESFDDVVAALEKQTHNMQRNHENRVKEGRILSSANRAKVQAAYDALGALLSESEPKPKEKQIDVEALRTQSLRVQSKAVAALL